MRVILFGIWLCVALGLPAEVQAKIPKEKLVTAAKPFVETALDTPMDVLIAKAVKDPTAKDQAFLGLAMLAGCHQPDDDQEVRNTQLLKDMEARLLPKSDAYLEAHPGIDIRAVNWVDVLEPTPDELLAVVHNQQHYSADYWLGLALTYRNMPVYSIGRFDVMGTGRATGGGGGHPVQGSSGLYNTDFVIKKDVLMTAAACVRAVRISAGLSYQGPRDLPAFVFLMRKFPYLDIDNTLATDEARSVEGKGYIGGPEACGTAAQFQTYVGILKTAG
jgi:hypothetical protein